MEAKLAIESSDKNAKIATLVRNKVIVEINGNSSHA